MKQTFMLTGLAFGLAACSLNDEVSCTMEFRTIGIQTDSLWLDEHYTVRLSNGDTLRHDTLHGFAVGYYVVLDDGAVGWLKDKTEDFVFEGWKNDSLIIRENYRIAADQCHIELVTGRTIWP